MSQPAESPIDLREDRFTRLRAIDWWDQSLLQRSRVLVVGAGALGNEVVKNLSLLGVGHLIIADMDVVEPSNLSRSVLFRPSDQGRPKAQCAARAAAGIYPEIEALAVVCNVLAGLGLGYFRWADVVVGALDNREARVFVNQACAQVGRAWIDGGIDVLNGIVRGFAPPATACYECTMGQRDWEQVHQRRSCSLLARRAVAHGGTPTTPTTASIIGAMQAQEVVKRLHGLQSLSGNGFVFEGLTHSSYAVGYPISPDCPWHENPPEIELKADWNSDTRLSEIWDWATHRLGSDPEAIDFSRELVEAVTCPSCQARREIFCPVDLVSEEDARCHSCGGECFPAIFSFHPAALSRLELTLRQLGVPVWDVLWPRSGQKIIGVEVGGDRPPGLA